MKGKSSARRLCELQKTSQRPSRKEEKAQVGRQQPGSERTNFSKSSQWLEAVGGGDNPDPERVPHSHADQWELGGAAKGGPCVFFLNPPDTKCTRPCLPLIEKIKLGIRNVFQMISGLVMLQKTGPGDSNLLSIQSAGKKNASYSEAVRPESWRGYFCDHAGAQKPANFQSRS